MSFSPPSYVSSVRQYVYLITSAPQGHQKLHYTLRPDFELRLIHPSEASRLCSKGWQKLMTQAVAVAVDWSEDNAVMFFALKGPARAAGVPLFALCGSNEAEHVAALVIGADDVLRQPLRPLLLQARLIAHGRHQQTTPSGSGDSQSTVPDAEVLEVTPTEKAERVTYAVGGARLDETARLFYIHGKPVGLTAKEFDLLALLMRDSGACCRRDDILNQVWGIDFDTETNVLDVHIYGLRRKLKRHGLGRFIQTVRGVGYRVNVVR